ncbi:MAG TPA: HEPN domain-containing protein, partial [Geminicoccaceae bacterium]|nr:HEPN domain-containing protein [Geminicoccaceae bacterium]
ADDDLAAIRGCLSVEPKALRGAAYHCQQAAEKMLKALLVSAGRPFRYVHDLDELADECALAWPHLEADLAGVRPLTRWATAFRYPGVGETFDHPPGPDQIESVLAPLAALRTRCAAIVAGAAS